HAGLLPEPVERLEQLRQLVGRKAFAGVLEADADATVRPDAAMDIDGTADPVVLDRVRQKVDEDLLDPRAIGVDEQRRGRVAEADPDAALARLRFDHRL